MSRLRVKGPRDGYRRAGLVFGKDWTEVSPAELSDEKVALLLEDERLVLQVADGKGDWSPLPVEERLQEVEAFRARPVVVGDGSGESLATLDPELLKAAELGRDLLATIDLHREMLEAHGLWPVVVPQALFLSFAGLLGTAEGNVGRLTAELETLKTTAAAEPSGDGGPAQVGAGGAENGGEGGQQDGGRQDPSAPAPEAAASASPPKSAKPATKSGRGKPAEKKAD